MKQNKITEVRFTHTFFHATAKPNVPSILKKGLLISERGTNRLGLDYDLDYNKIYSSEEVAQHGKPPSIHLTEDYENAKEYQQLIEKSFGLPAIILKVIINSIKDTLKPDTEADNAYICLNNIDSDRISLANSQDSLTDDEDDKSENVPDDEGVLENSGPSLTS